MGCVLHFVFLCLTFLYLVLPILDDWDEAHKYLIQAKNGNFQGVVKQKYGRGQREHVPRKVYSPPSDNGRAKKLHKSNKTSSANISAGFLTETLLPIPPPSLRASNMNLPTAAGYFILIMTTL
jgi:hypothetical protein